MVEKVRRTAQEGRPLTTAAMEMAATSGMGAPAMRVTRVARMAAKRVIVCILAFYKD
jgi:hypothetical protein